MPELMIAVALWCGQVLVHNGIYIKPQATTEQVDQCRKNVIECLESNDIHSNRDMMTCFEKQRLPGGKQ